LYVQTVTSVAGSGGGLAAWETRKQEKHNKP
jgi:hypothetical protein